MPPSVDNADEKHPFIPAPLACEITGKVPQTCTGARPFLCIVFWWCLLTLLIPLAVLLPIYFLFHVGNQAILIVLCILAGLGLLVCCFSLRQVIVGACCPPPIPPEHSAFQNMQDAQTRDVKSLVLIINPFGGGGKGLVTLEKVSHKQNKSMCVQKSVQKQ